MIMADNESGAVRPPFDSELAEALPALNARMRASLTLSELIASRSGPTELSVSSDGTVATGEFMFATELVPWPNGDGGIKILVCTPRCLKAPIPIVYYMHGGGMVAGDYRTTLDTLLPFACDVGFAVASVDYRLAPEHPFPVGIEDCYMGLSWLCAEGARLGLDTRRIVIAGSSAGGGLAAALALMCRDRGGPTVIGQLLRCPMLDDRCDSVSSYQMLGEGLWDRESNLVGWRALLGPAQGTEFVSVYAAPARAGDLGGLAPIYIEVGSAETFRDECVEYARRVWVAGGEAELHVWSGGFHGFDYLVPSAHISRDAVAMRGRWLERIFNRPEA
jgi:acetyl esterase/lipase